MHHCDYNPILCLSDRPRIGACRWLSRNRRDNFRHADRAMHSIALSIFCCVYLGASRDPWLGHETIEPSITDYIFGEYRTTLKCPENAGSPIETTGSEKATSQLTHLLCWRLWHRGRMAGCATIPPNRRSTTGSSLLATAAAWQHRSKRE